MDRRRDPLETLIARGELDRASALAGRFSFKATESVWSAWLAYALASLALARDDPAAAIAHATECRLVLRGWSLERWPPIPWRGLLACASPAWERPRAACEPRS